MHMTGQLPQVSLSHVVSSSRLSMHTSHLPGPLRPRFWGMHATPACRGCAVRGPQLHLNARVSQAALGH